MATRPYNGFTPAERAKAAAWAKKEWMAGRLPTPSHACCVCGQSEGIVEPHSEDYSEPYGPHVGAFAVCYRCHQLMHARFRNPGAFRWYTEQVRGGAQFAPATERDYGRYIVPLLTQREKPTRHADETFSPDPAVLPPPYQEGFTEHRANLTLYTDPRHAPGWAVDELPAELRPQLTLDL